MIGIKMGILGMLKGIRMAIPAPLTESRIGGRMNINVIIMTLPTKKLILFSRLLGLCFLGLSGHYLLNHTATIEVQAQTAPPTAILYVGSLQQTDYVFSVDGSDSHSASTDTFTYKDDIVEFIWDFGDNTPIDKGEYLNTHTHIYTHPGTYTVTLTVVDKDGNTDSATAQVTATDLPRQTVSGNTTSAIQSAINSLGGQVGIVYIPAGDYIHNRGGLDIPAGVILEGAGSANTRLYIPSSSGVLLQPAGNNVRITGLKIEGYSTVAAVSQSTEGISISGSIKNVLIDHCEALGFRAAIIIVWSSSATIEHCHIHHNTMNGYGYGVLTSGEAYSMIRYNEFGSCRHIIAGGGCEDYTPCPTRYDVIDNHFQGYDGVENLGFIVDMHAAGHGRLRVNHNVFEDLKGGIAFNDGLNVQIKNNTFRNIDYRQAISLEPPVHYGMHDGGIDGADIRDNTFENVETQLQLCWGKNIYINCRNVDDLVPWSESAYCGNYLTVDWNDCGSNPCSDNYCDINYDCNNCPDYGDCTASQCNTSPSPADINQDGSVNSIDIQLCVNVLTGQETDPVLAQRADVNNDGVVNSFDIELIVRKIIGVLQ
jgi:PKD repeat protein